MTSRELFIKTFKAEQKLFEKVLKAVNQKKWNYRPDKVSRTGQQLIGVFSEEFAMMEDIAGKGKVIMDKASKLPKTVSAVIASSKKSITKVIKAVEKLSEKEWESADAIMTGAFGEWKDKKGNMLWGFLLDLIHHRGQLSTYLRAMGGKVPSIYGPSADSK